MLIPQSTLFRYWPEVSYELGWRMIHRVYNYRVTYETLLVEFGGVDMEGDNITYSECKSLIEDALGELTEEEFPEGWVDDRSTVVDLLEILSDGNLTYDDIPESDAQVAQAALGGYMLWQRYRLYLLIQANKLSEFGRRGRPVELE